jgi:hypothetical protein
MKLDPGMHIVMHLVFFGKAGVTAQEQDVIQELERAELLHERWVLRLGS